MKFLGRSCFKAWSGNEAFHLTISVFKILQRTKALLRQTDSKLLLIQQPLSVSRMKLDSRWTPAVSPGDSDDSVRLWEPKTDLTLLQRAHLAFLQQCLWRGLLGFSVLLTPGLPMWPDLCALPCPAFWVPPYPLLWQASHFSPGWLGTYVAWASLHCQQLPASASWELGLHVWVTKPLLCCY